MTDKHSRTYFSALVALGLTGTAIIGYSWLGINRASASDRPEKPPRLSDRAPKSKATDQMPNTWSNWQSAMNSAGIAPYVNEAPVLAETHNDRTYIRVLADPNYIADGMLVLEKIMRAPDTASDGFSLTRVYRQIPADMADVKNPSTLLELSTKNMPLLRNDPVRMERATFDKSGSMTRIDRYRDIYYSESMMRELPSYEITTKDSEEHRYYADQDQNIPNGLGIRTFIMTNGKRLLTSESYFAAGPNGHPYQSKLLVFGMNGEVKEMIFPAPVLAPTPAQHQNGGR